MVQLQVSELGLLNITITQTFLLGPASTLSLSIPNHKALSTFDVGVDTAMYVYMYMYTYICTCVSSTIFRKEIAGLIILLVSMESLLYCNQSIHQQEGTKGNVPSKRC